MKKDTESWLRYADENLKSAEILMGSGLFNPSLQNAQQAVEKYLKAVLIEKSSRFDENTQYQRAYCTY